MSTQLQLRRGNAAENTSFVGALGEITVDTENNVLHLHDGSTTGGHILGAKGDTGATGPTGATGATGPRGLTGDLGYASNCLTQIPQDINLKEENNSLVLKANSKIHSPNGNINIPSVEDWSATENNIIGEGNNWLGMSIYKYNGNDDGIYMLNKSGILGYFNGAIYTTGSTQYINTNLSFNKLHSNGLIGGSSSLVRGSCAFECGQYTSSSTTLYRSVVITETGYISYTGYPTSTWSTFTYNANLGNKDWKALVFNSTSMKWIALSAYGWISTSTDGITWTNATQITELSSIKEKWFSLIWDGTKYIALGSTTSTTTGTMHTATSTDGSTWVLNTDVTYTEAGSLPSEDHMVGLAYSGSLYIAISAYGNVSTSTDGTTWTTPARYVQADAYIAGICYLNKTDTSLSISPRFYIYTRTGQQVYYTTNGTAWTLVRANILNSALYATGKKSIVYDGTQILVLGSDGYLHYSTDGSTWATAYGQLTLVTDYNYYSRSWQNLVYNGTTYSAIGNGSGSIYVLSTSTDPVSSTTGTWTTPTQIYALNNKDISDIIYDGTQYIAIGHTNSPYVYNSTDLQNWTENTDSNLQHSTASGYDRNLCYFNGKYVALSSEGKINTSLDGVSWTATTDNTDLGTTVQGWNSITHDSVKFIALSKEGYISTSTDGSTWTTPVQNTDLSNNGWELACYDNTQFIALSSGTGYYNMKTYCALTTNSTSTPSYSTTTLSQDKTFTFNGETGTYMLFEDGSYFTVNKCVSGTTDSLAGTTYHIWYDTTNNLVKMYGSDTTTPLKTVGFPIAVVTLSSGTVTSINQVFNGFGYIGNTTYILPSVMGLIPNGRSSTGIVANTEFLTLNPIIKTDTTSTGTFVLTTDGTTINYDSAISYDLTTNKNSISGTTVARIPYGSITLSSGNVSSLTTKTTMTLADLNNIA